MYMEICNIFGFETKFVPDICGNIQIKMTLFGSSPKGEEPNKFRRRTK